MYRPWGTGQNPQKVLLNLAEQAGRNKSECPSLAALGIQVYQDPVAPASARRLFRTSVGLLIRMFAPALPLTSWLIASRPQGWPNSSRVFAATWRRGPARSWRSL